MDERSKAQDFLDKYGLAVDGIDFKMEVERLLMEMDRGLKGEGTLQMLPTYLSLDKGPKYNEPVVVIDAGGTNFRVALVHFDANKKMVIDSFKKHRMPGTSGVISKTEFFDQMAELVRPVINQSQKIGFCFSYPVEIKSNHDGSILYFTKELNVEDGVGAMVGESLLSALGAKNKQIAILNDTVATLLGGAAAYPDRKFGSYIGLILGTGVNTAYIENNSNIIKSEPIRQMPGHMLINIESGGYHGVARSHFDEILHSKSNNAGECGFEKMISGAYQGMLTLIVLKEAAKEQLFTEEAATRILALLSLESYELDKFQYYPYGDGVLAQLCENDCDRSILFYLIEQIMERVAKLTAINLAATVKKSGSGMNPLEPVCILAEGTTFYKAKGLRDKIMHYLKKEMTDEMGLYADVLAANDVTLLGSAIAALLL